MEKRWSVLPVLAGASLLFASCYPGEVTSLGELDVVITAHDDTVTFTSFTTYLLLDSVVHIDVEDAANDSLLDRTNDALILSEVRDNIEAFGYVAADTLVADPDVVFLVGAFAVAKDAYFSWGWWGWWGGWYGWPCCYGPGWGWGYPPTGGVGSVSYATGTLLITQVDPTRLGTLPADSLAPALWLAGINGLLEGSAISQMSRITTLIDQAFKQSEDYLKIN